MRQRRPRRQQEDQKSPKNHPCREGFFHLFWGLETDWKSQEFLEYRQTSWCFADFCAFFEATGWLNITAPFDFRVFGKSSFGENRRRKERVREGE